MVIVLHSKQGPYDVQVVGSASSFNIRGPRIALYMLPCPAATTKTGACCARCRMLLAETVTLTDGNAPCAAVRSRSSCRVKSHYKVPTLCAAVLASTVADLPWQAFVARLVLLDSCVCLYSHACVQKKQSCPHIDAWPSADAAMTADAFEQHMKQFIDPDTGERRLTCVSRAHIPEDLRHGDRAAQWAGVPIWSCNLLRFAEGHRFMLANTLAQTPFLHGSARIVVA